MIETIKIDKHKSNTVTLFICTQILTCKLDYNWHKAQTKQFITLTDLYRLH